MRATSGLHLHTSNYLENLFADLAGLVANPLGSVFPPETIVVQSIGMGRWLSLRLAEAHGICANVQFPFPQKFVSDIFRAALPDAPVSNAFDRDVLPWRIMRLLPGLVGRNEFEAVRHYLAGERPALKLYQLAHKMAEVFDRYLAFRPAMVLDWDAGKDQHWQAILWRALAQEDPEAHQPALGRQLADTLRGGGGLGRLPPRVSIFGLSTLPRFYLDIIQAIAGRTEVHLFVMEPTPQWWQDVVSPREEARILKQQPGRKAEELHLERGNSLLASMGKQGRDFLGLVADLEPVEHRESFAEPEGATLLARMQRDIYLLEDRDAARPFLPNDHSIQFHSCHSPMREMEVLHDQLLAAFENDPALQPKDVVVMMPEVASYAPFIEAVFATPESEELRVPFTIADRTARAESGVIDTFLAILDLSISRFGASSVLNILESPAVQQRFDLAESDLGTIRAWLDKAAIRWGIDGAHRAQFDIPAFAQNSWREGLDRLLLGYALPVYGEQLFHDILPIDEIEGSLAETLGNLVEFIDALFLTAAEVTAARSLVQWQTALRQIVERFFAPTDEVGRELLRVRHVLDSLGAISRQAGFEAAVPFDVLLAHLNRLLSDSDSGSGFLVGRVTFCALKPMRSIPFKIVCLVGMNDTAYPRKSSALGFDLMTERPQPGDRATRDDDRYLFLEALLSARQLFYLSYIGQSLRDNSALPPSVLVSELLDYLGGDQASRESLVTKHRLQPFHSDYFGGDPALFSYSKENCRASAAAGGERSSPPPFFSRALAPPEEEWRTVRLENLFRFYRNPAQFFLQNRLGIRLPNEDRVLEEREPFALDSLERYKIAQDLLSKRLANVNLAEEESLVRGGGQFPPGLPGDATYLELRQSVAPFAEIVRPHLAATQPPAAVDLSIGDWTLTGRIAGLTDTGLLSYRLTKIKPLDLLRTWICHLALNCSTPVSSRLLTENEAYIFDPVSESEGLARLHDLLDIYGRGWCEPVPFFPKSSLAFATQSIKPNRRQEPLRKALGEWEGSGWGVDFPEKDNPYIALAFRGATDPLNEEWQQLALRIFQPALEARKELET